ncbi:DUF3800 domain-containing protein [Priestia aryabhattai]|uniref:DUF3800 domain-containing protein n=1 Tax=Priestia aryabhattai TaxID=412384 RepID=UPI0023B0F4B9|nr:DUF3800 domain-containing protein [Priestia aryabhattai]MDE8676557.1 DUF3800 domain-containing protein [Priestia aryabhattai]
MNHYSLFLDEIHAGGHFDYFCLAGVAFNTTEYINKVIPAVEQIKYNLFGETSTILHEQKINSHKSGTPFEVFQDREVTKGFWSGINNILSSHETHGFAVGINEKELRNMYVGGRDKYFVALQVIIENFVHFLETVDASGTIHIESSDPHPFQHDEQLNYHFQYLKANGTLFYDKRTLQRRLGSLNVQLKADNIIGLQIADLIPNSLNRYLCNKKQRTYGLIDVYQKIAYDGKLGNKKRFGIKLVP